MTPPSNATSLPSTQAAAPPSSYKLSDAAPDHPTIQSPPMNTAVLNNSPAPIPIPTSPTAVSIATPDSNNPEPAVTPTVAETGIPVSAGENGPGPASGSLHDIHAASPTAGPRSGGLPGRRSSGADLGYGQSPGGVATGAAAATPAKFESAEDEKKRLQREDRERILAAQGPPAALQAQAPTTGSTSSPAFESAADEKKRLEREQREKILRAGGSDATGGSSGPKKDDEDLPPYQAL